MVYNVIDHNAVTKKTEHEKKKKKKKTQSQTSLMLSSFGIIKLMNIIILQQ
jgi:hypothetical protein